MSGLLWLAAFCIAVLSVPRSLAAERKRIAYFEGGSFWLLKFNFKAFQQELAKYPEFEVAYPPELHFSPGWDASPEQLDLIADAIQAREDVSLIIAGGTSAVRALLRRNTGKIPIIGMGMADPVASKIVAGPDDSGVENFTCEVIVDRWKQMLRVFHDVVGFSTLGIIYPQGPEGRLYSAVDDARAVAGELGFSVLEHVIPDEESCSCSDGMQWLHENGADAFFIGPLTCFDWELNNPAPLIERLNREFKMPSFARDGSGFVQGGALMGFATWDFSIAGGRFARQAVKIFQGASPRSLPMRATMEPLIAINLQTAGEIGFDLPFDVLIAADEIYAITTTPTFE